MRQQHHTKPAQSAGFDEVAVRGAYRIAVDATRLDLAPPSSLKSVIETDYDRAIGNKRADQELQQTAGDPSARPAVAVQHPMIVGEARPLLQPHDTKCRGNGPPSGLSIAPAISTRTCRQVGTVKQSPNGCSQTASRFDIPR